MTSVVGVEFGQNILSLVHTFCDNFGSSVQEISFPVFCDGKLLRQAQHASFGVGVIRFRFLNQFPSDLWRPSFIFYPPYFLGQLAIVFVPAISECFVVFLASFFEDPFCHSLVPSWIIPGNITRHGCFIDYFRR